MYQFENLFAQEVWSSTYKYFEDKTVEDTWRRVSRALSSVEKTEELKKKYERKFYELLYGFNGLVGGRTSANAGTKFKGTTCINCYVGPKPDYDQDSVEGILSVLLSQVKTLKSEGGW